MCRLFDSTLRHLLKNFYKNNLNIFNLSLKLSCVFATNTNTKLLKHCKPFFQNIFILLVKVVKLKLKGKTLRIKKFNNYTIFFKFGITHPAIDFLTFNTRFKKKGKQKFFLFNYSQQNLIENAKSFCSLKPYNIYHGRGIRMVRIKLYRKAGKVSEYFK